MPAGDPIRINVVLLGSKGSGKTALSHKWLTNKYVPNPERTIGADSAVKEITLPITHEKVQVVLWDTAGSLPENLLNSYINNATLCFITVEATLEHDEKIKQINRYRELIKKRLAQFPLQIRPKVVVIETKHDNGKKITPITSS